MVEISAAGREQEVGIGQINQAVIEMDNVTQQNAALVEEAAAAASALQEQAAHLAQIVSVFKLEAGATNVRPFVAPASKPRKALASPPARRSGKPIRRPDTRGICGRRRALCRPGTWRG
ncbi:hypothetical protein LP419_23655 [Massilia sp. H-1]|nr:hypothetical protein LP419_23655 [Massilia sp. H-1]